MLPALSAVVAARCGHPHEQSSLDAHPTRTRQQRGAGKQRQPEQQPAPKADTGGLTPPYGLRIIDEM
eukprot:6013528-Pleurochrysis_carterae.AAC.2